MNEKKPLKVMIINGSARPDSNTSHVLTFMCEIFERNGVSTVQLDIPADLPGCTGCAACKTSGRCVQNDLVTQATDLWDECDGLLVGSPVYFSGISGSVKCFMDRLCYSSMRDRLAKVGGAVVCVRRGGGTAAIVAGAGLWGCTVARVLAERFGVCGINTPSADVRTILRTVGCLMFGAWWGWWG